MVVAIVDQNKTGDLLWICAEFGVETWHIWIPLQALLDDLDLGCKSVEGLRRLRLQLEHELLHIKALHI